MKQVKRFISCIMVIFMCMLMMPENAYSANMHISVSGGEYHLGDVITVTVSSSAEGSYFAQGTLTYNPAVLKNDSAAGSFNMLIEDGNVSIGPFSGSITFTCIAPGNGGISLNNVVAGDINGNVLEVTQAISPITVTNKPEIVLSSDASLTGLLTSLGRVNAADGSWTLSCGHEVTDFAIAPEVAAGAKWSATGDFNNLKEGTNQFTIIVTAEDGVTQKTYPITVIRAAAPQTSAPSTTEPTEPTTEEPSSEEETSSEAVDELVAELINGDVLNVAESLEEIELPEGYEKITYNYAGTEIEAASAANGVILLYLTDADGENGAFYVYNEETKLCAPFVTIEAKDTLLILPLPKDVEVPEDYEEIELSLGEEIVTAWALDEEEKYCLVYGVYRDGEEGFYRYDKEEGTFLRYQPDEASDASLEELQKKNQALAAKYEQDMQIRMAVIIALGVLCLILLIVVIVLLTKKNKKNDNPPTNPADTKKPVIPPLFEDEEEELEDWEDSDEESSKEEQNIPVEAEPECVEEEVEQEEEMSALPEEKEVLPNEEMEIIPEEEAEQVSEKEVTEPYDKELLDFEASIEEILRQSFPARMEEWMNMEDEGISDCAEPVEEEPIAVKLIEKELPVEEVFEEESMEEELPEEELLVEELFDEEPLMEEFSVEDQVEKEPSGKDGFVEELFADAEESEKDSAFSVSNLYGETKVDGVDIEEDLDVYFSRKPEKKTPKKGKKAVPKQEETPVVEKNDDNEFEFIEF